MTNLKKLAVLGAVVLAVGATSVTAFAASNFRTPAEVASGVTGRTVGDVTAEKFEKGISYGTIAKNSEKLNEFKSEINENKIAVLNERVAEGSMTQEEADKIMLALEENQAVCDGTGTARTGQQFGASFGGMMGNGSGNGQGQGQGQGQENGQGKGLNNGQGMVRG
ncbi:MAG: hypothetical protein ACERLG_01305, partial [Sedimentibacter sp.]